MESLKIRGNRNEFFTPNVSLDAQSGNCEIAGESYLEYTGEFYDKIIQWVKAYFEEGNKSLRFDFKLTYFNTSSFKAILTVLRFLKNCERQGLGIDVNWYYHEDDIDILREAQDLAEGAELDLTYIPMED